MESGWDSVLPAEPASDCCSGRSFVILLPSRFHVPRPPFGMGGRAPPRGICSLQRLVGAPPWFGYHRRMGTFYVENFGCRATQADGAAIEREFRQRGLERAPAP